MPAGILLLLAVAKTGAENPRHALVPRQLHEGLGIGNADQLRGLGAVADVVLVPIDVQIRGRTIDQLEAALGDALPMIGRNALADDASGHRDELAVEVLDAQLVDLLAHLLDEIAPARRHLHGHPNQSLRSPFETRSARRSPRCRVNIARALSSTGTGCWKSDAVCPRRSARSGTAASSSLGRPQISSATSLPDADHLVAVVRVGNHVDVLAEAVEHREIVGGEGADAAGRLLLE